MYLSDGVNWQGNVSFKFDFFLDHSIFKLYLSVQDISAFSYETKYTHVTLQFFFTNRMQFCDMLNKIRNDFLKHNFETPFFKAANHDFVFWNTAVKHVPDSPKRHAPHVFGTGRRLTAFAYICRYLHLCYKVINNSVRFNVWIFYLKVIILTFSSYV